MPRTLITLVSTGIVRAKWVAFSLGLVGVLGGCQVFSPGALGTLTTSRDERRVLKEAETDPFPSPADVGIAAPAALASKP
jgi:hypothetical protein